MACKEQSGNRSGGESVRLAEIIQTATANPEAKSQQTVDPNGTEVTAQGTFGRTPIDPFSDDIQRQQRRPVGYLNANSDG